MAVTRGATVTQFTDSDSTIGTSFSHTVNSGTSLLVVSFHCEGDLTISSPAWNTTETMTLITSVTTATAGGDVRVYVYGRVAPTAATANITYSVSGTGYDNLAVVAVNYLGTIASSVDDATNPIDTEDNGNAASQTIALSGSTTAGSTLVCAGTFYGDDGDPATVTGVTGFTDVATSDTGGGSSSTDTSYYYGDKIGGGTGGTLSPTIDWTGTANDECVGVFFEILPGDKTISPTVGTVRTAGQTPTVAQTWSASPTVATVRLIGQEPTLDIGSSDTAALVDFDTPTNPPKLGADEQRFRVLVRKTDTADPTVDISLYEGGVEVTALVTGTTVTSATGQIIEAYWDASALSDPSGAGVQCYIFGHGNGASRVEIGAVVWESRATANVTASPTVGTVRLVGQQPDVDQTWSVTPSVGTVRVVGQAPTVSVTTSVSPTTGIVRTVGQQATVSQTWSASPSVGTVRTVGQTPTVAQTWSASPTVGTVRLVGQTPTIAVTMTVAPSAGTVRTVGQQPTVDQTWSASPEAGTVRISGYAPVLAQTWSAAPASGLIRIVGNQPEVIYAPDKTVSPSSGVLRFEGQAPQILVPGIDVEQPSGGWAGGFRIEQERDRRKARERQREIEEELAEERERQALADRLEAQLREEGVLADAEAERMRLAALVAQYRVDELPNRVQRALRYAERAQSDLAIQLALREMQRVAEEEELAVLMALALD